MDSCKWSQNRFETIKQAFSITLKENKFNPDEVQFIPVSAHLGQNIYKKHKDTWYEGPSLIEALETKSNLIQSNQSDQLLEIEIATKSQNL
jgi:elongation factor 1-alpha